MGRAKQDFESRMDMLAVLLADLIYIKEGDARASVVNIDIRDRLDKLAGRVRCERLIQMAEFLRFIESSLKSHVNRQILTDVLALTGNETVRAVDW